MDKKDAELINLLQMDFPLSSRPFHVLAQKLNITEDEVLHRIEDLKENGYIRKLGCIFNLNKLGYSSTLCALKVHKHRVEEVACIINSFEGVTHNYIRNHNYNMWFTMIAESKEKLKDNIEDIRSKTQIDQILNLSAVKVFKIKVNFNLKVE